MPRSQTLTTLSTKLSYVPSLVLFLIYGLPRHLRSCLPRLRKSGFFGVGVIGKSEAISFSRCGHPRCVDAGYNSRSV